MYYRRTAEKLIKEAHEQFGNVLVVGAPQAGKRTILKNCTGFDVWVALDKRNPEPISIRTPPVDSKMRFRCEYFTKNIIAEIHHEPNFLKYMPMVKEDEYCLTSSRKLHTLKNIPEDFTKRVGIVTLMGLSLKELGSNPDYEPFLPTAGRIKNQCESAKKYSTKELYEIIHRGSLPAINVDKDQSREEFYSTYLQTYIEKDILEKEIREDYDKLKQYWRYEEKQEYRWKKDPRYLIKENNKTAFEKFVQAVATKTGQMLNYADIASSVGISEPTAKCWLSILVASGLVYLLQPYHQKINKRMIKSPKVYFLDTGLCSYLSEWETPEALEAGEMSEAIFETFVVVEILKSYYHNGKEPPVYYYNDKDKREIDLIIEEDGKLYPVQIKKTEKPNKADIKHFKLLPNYEEGAVICLCDQDFKLTDNINAIHVGYV